MAGLDPAMSTYFVMAGLDPAIQCRPHSDAFPDFTTAWMAGSNARP
jgi:hypothetical protein